MFSGQEEYEVGSSVCYEIGQLWALITGYGPAATTTLIVCQRTHHSHLLCSGLA